MRSWLHFALAQRPGLYAGLLRRRRSVNLEKLSFLALVQRDDVVLDAGANGGYYTVLFSHLVGRRGRVHAFEPLPPTFAALAAYVERERRFDNVVLNDSALAASDGVVELFVPGSDHGHAAIARHRAGSWVLAPEVRSYTRPAITIDTYLAARGEEPPAFVKCDVEGAELRVLEGAATTLRRRPPILHLEINPDWTRTLGYEPSDLVRFLAAYGYSRFYLVGDVVSRALLDPSRELAAFRGSENLICAVPELHEARLRRLRLTGAAGAGAGAGGSGSGGGSAA